MTTALTIMTGGHVPDFRVADTAPEHPKLRAAGLAAAGLWAMAGGFAMRELTDGWVPEYWVASWPSGTRHAATLVRVGLWTKYDRHGIPGYLFHDWLSIQRPAAKIHEDRTKGKERAARSRERSAERSPSRTADVRAESHDSLSLSLALTPKGSTRGGTSSTERAQDQHGPPAPNLAPNNPRCAEHADIPATERGPNCRACAAIRAEVERAVATVAAEDDPSRAERARVLAARDCSWCNRDGWRIDPANRHRGPLLPHVRCDHTPLLVEASS